MTTEVILTGTGSRTPSLAGSAPGPRGKQDVALQFDAGRATVLRMVAAGTRRHGSMALATLLLT
jgi:hypothetical protein